MNAIDAAHHLAQVNIGRLRAPVDAPEIEAFVAALDPINALADAAPGFVWRLQTEDGNATAVRVDDDPLIAINMSVWTSVEALAEFVYRSAHTDVMRRRREWFHKMDVYAVLWWVPAGHRPSTDEAMARLALLHERGPTADAFTFRHPFPPPGSDETIDTDERWNCRA
jgi:hypothetical protein